MRPAHPQMVLVLVAIISASLRGWSQSGPQKENFGVRASLSAFEFDHERRELWFARVSTTFGFLGTQYPARELLLRSEMPSSISLRSVMETW
jgi:hypothetical protein